MSKFKAGAIILGLGLAVLVTVEANRRVQASRYALSILPVPAHLETRNGTFQLRPDSRILTDEAGNAGTMLAERLRVSTGYPLPLSTAAQSQQSTRTILLEAHGANAALGAEGYELDVTPDQVRLRANGQAGLLYGTQSLLELFPPQIFSGRVSKRRNWTIPCVTVRDQPRFAWRGLMLDVSRHFFTPPEIKTVLDAMVLHKLNTFHWHLTDDQGWRIEIKKYPRLTEVGAWRKRIGFNLDPKASTAYDSAGRYGGYYSQAEVRDIVEYARARNITIVPEIDIPGHSSAALAACPQFSCSGGPYSTDMSEAVSAGVFCPGKEETFEFLQNILREVIGLFPGPFIHVGGDEVPKQNWRNCPRCQARIRQEGLKDEHDLQHYFFHRIEQFIDANGKRAVGWSEIGSGQVAQNTILMDWIGGGVAFARSGRDVVMCPEEFCYFDFYQSKDRLTEPPAAGAYLPLEKVFSFEPIPPQLELDQQKHFLGAQANIWTEYIPSLARLEYMAFPRLCALAEVVWSPKDSRDWVDFTRRLPVHEQRLEYLGIQYRR